MAHRNPAPPREVTPAVCITAILCMIAGSGLGACARDSAPGASAEPKAALPDPAAPPAPRAHLFTQELPGHALRFDMAAVPGDPGAGIQPFWIGRTEVTWEVFDIFVYRLDEPDTADADAATRPSKPYLPPDRGFGHDGFAAIGMSHHSAQAFCAWISAKTGRRYRLPTEAEWEHACGSAKATAIDDAAWHAGNSGGTPHAAGTRKPNALGIADLLGNVAEWCDGRDGQPVIKGGSYRDPARDLSCAARRPFDPAWNQSDPQIPKSRWWLADAPFIGFRVVCENAPAAAGEAP